MLWHYARGKPKEAIESDQQLTISWQGEVFERLRKHVCVLVRLSPENVWKSSSATETVDRSFHQSQP